MRLRSLLPAAVLAGAALFFGPQAHADEAAVEFPALPEVQQLVDLVQLPELPPLPPAPVLPEAPVEVTQFFADVAAAGEQLQRQFDTAVAQYADPIIVESPVIMSPEGVPMVDVFQKPNGPNYQWADDPVSKFMAQKFDQDKVLHRVEDSWFDAPRAPRESIAAQINGTSLYGPGTPVYVGDTALCTLGVAGIDAHGNKVGLTAAHCGQVGEKVYSADSWETGVTGEVVATNAALDYSVIKLADNASVSRTYNGVTVNSFGKINDIPTMDIFDLGKANLCKMGVATGLTCGQKLYNVEQLSLAQVCAMQGDSGAPVLAGDRLVGMVSGGVLPAGACHTPWQGALFVPTIVSHTDAMFADLDAQGGVGAGMRLPDPALAYVNPQRSLQL